MTNYSCTVNVRPFKQVLVKNLSYKMNSSIDLQIHDKEQNRGVQLLDVVSGSCLNTCTDVGLSELVYKLERCLYEGA